jgi:hypothetical protein
MAGTQLPLHGDLGFQVLVGLLEPAFDAVDRSHFGLVLDANWCYGIFRDRGGHTYAVLRKIIQRTTPGCVLETNLDGGQLAPHPASGSLARGGRVGRSTSETGCVYESQFGIPEQPFHIRFAGDAVEWVEGDDLSLSGRSAAPGVQIYFPWREGGCYYTSFVFDAKGTILGADVEGHICFDQAFLPPGVEWNESHIYTWLEDGWVVFITEYDDGSFEWGQAAFGRERFGFAVIADRQRALVATGNVTGEMHLKGNGYPERVVYHVSDPDEEWAWRADPDCEIHGFSGARPGYFAGAGIMQRVGDTRRPRLWGSWQEIYRRDATR